MGKKNKAKSEIKSISPNLKKLIGSVKLPKNIDEDKERRKYLSKKHS